VEGELPKSDAVPAARSLLMAKIGSKNSRPEMAVRRAAHNLGYRFRLHRRDLPGTPDLIFPRMRKAIFVHGCFWHRHPGCSRTTTPKTRTDFWSKKFGENQARDRRVLCQLTELGWQVLVIWECETKDTAILSEKLQAFLAQPCSREVDDPKPSHLCARA